MAVAQRTGDTAFKTLGIADGLRSNSVTSVLVDSRGYLWIGTYQGLNRYDGHQVKTRFPESGDPSFYDGRSGRGERHEVFSETTTSLEEDAAGRIWIGCESGAYHIYDTQTAQFQSSPEGTLQAMGIRLKGAYKVKVGQKGGLWVLTEGGINRYDYHTKELKTWKLRVQLPGKTAGVVAEMSDGLYYGAGHSVWHLLTSTGELKREALPEVMEKSTGEVSMLADADGTLWIYSTREESICRYIVGGRRVCEMVSLPQTSGASQNNAIRDMMDDGRGNIWVATDHKGLFVYNKSTGAITSLRHERTRQLSLASDNATCMTIDRQGTIWVGHMKTGLSYTSDANNIMQSHAQSAGDILAMAYDTKGNLWMGTDGDGVYIEHTDGSIQKTALPNITVMSLTSDGRGGMWAGTYNQGLYHLTDAAHWKRYAIDLGTYPTEYVWTLAADNQGRIWSSSPIGKTVIFDPKDETTRTVTNDSGEDIRANAIRYDGAGAMLIGSVYGLWTYDLKNGTCSVAFGNKRDTQRWLNQMVTGVSVDRQKGLMMLAHPDGVMVYDTKCDTLSYIRRNNDIVKGLARDRDGAYWICTTSGSIVGIQTKRQAEGLEIIRRSFLPSVGMPQFYFNGDAMTCSAQGEILMGGTEGYMSINPRQLMATKTEEYSLTISEIAVGDSLLNEHASTVQLNYDDAYLSVRFFSGSLENVQRIRYAYRLVGQMNDWVMTDQNCVSFHTLPPGNYTLQLCVCREGGSVALAFRIDGDNAIISVADTGKGIPDSDKPNIFKRFYQSASNDSSQTGSGIGLHIASDYVQLHKGTISVSDNQPVGSIFTITLPAKSGKRTMDGYEPTENSQQKTILIVDDNKDMLQFVSSCMKEDYQVYTATDGAAALELLQREQIDLIISDVMMPGIDGFELCRRVKSDINLSHIPVILLTARTTDVSRIEGLQLGADDYLTKPFNVEVLRLRVQKFIDWEQDNHRQFRQKMDIEPSEITITPLDEQFIQKAIALVEKNISDSEFSVETMAAEVGMARTTLYKKLMAITGLGPAEFIRTIRVKRGKALLETSQMQITEIAYAVGFTTVKSFTMNFKAEYGMTPTEFRQKFL